MPSPFYVPRQGCLHQPDDFVGWPRALGIPFSHNARGAALDANAVAFLALAAIAVICAVLALRHLVKGTRFRHLELWLGAGGLVATIAFGSMVVGVSKLRGEWVDSVLVNRADAGLFFDQLTWFVSFGYGGAILCSMCAASGLLCLAANFRPLGLGKLVAAASLAFLLVLPVVAVLTYGTSMVRGFQEGRDANTDARSVIEGGLAAARGPLWFRASIVGVAAIGGLFFALRARRHAASIGEAMPSRSRIAAGLVLFSAGVAAFASTRAHASDLSRPLPGRSSAFQVDTPKPEDLPLLGKCEKAQDRVTLIYSAGTWSVSDKQLPSLHVLAEVVRKEFDKIAYIAKYNPVVDLHVLEEVGILASAATPMKDIAPVLSPLADAGVRRIYLYSARPFTVETATLGPVRRLDPCEAKIELSKDGRSALDFESLAALAGAVSERPVTLAPLPPP